MRSIVFEGDTWQIAKGFDDDKDPETKQISGFSESGIAYIYAGGK